MDASISIKNIREILTQQLLIEDGLEQYERYIVQIEYNKTNDPIVAFEATKSFGEAIFKHILAHPRIKVEYSDILTSSSPSTYNLFKACVKALVDLDLLDIELLGFGQKFFNDISQIRNSVGIISHGKDLRSTAKLRSSKVEFTISITLSCIIILLEAYEGLLDVQPTAYEENVDFNEFLDSQYEGIGIKYSQALYDQDFIAYNELLDEYNVN